MNKVSIRIIDGPERGKVFDDLSLPVSIGREKGNSIVIDDERMSRFHVKIFEEAPLCLLADLDSTNGTRVNGETTMLWALRPGDLITIGNTLLVFGSRRDVVERLADIRKSSLGSDAVFMGVTPAEVPSVLEQNSKKTTSEHSLAYTSAMMLQDELFNNVPQEDLILLRSLFPPHLPAELSAGQAAELSKLFFYFCLRFRTLVDGVRSVESSEVNVRDLAAKGDRQKKSLQKKYHDKDSRVTLSAAQWQNLLDLYNMFSHYMEQSVKQEEITE
ncbi:MAG: FHA domain-containing protein [Thermoguttaceae bacterium]|nr:FHA domain-containing protein [Thermoguttaceae bacterium]